MIDATQPAGGNQVLPEASQSRKTGFIDQEQFLKLLVAQLENQDPLSPMESQEFASQMAQFASLERLHSIDTRLAESLDAEIMSTQAINNTMAASLIGKQVVASGDSLVLTNGIANLHFSLAAYAKDVEIVIYDEEGNTVQTLWRHKLGQGENLTVWDGTNYNGNSVVDGTYTYSVHATDQDGNQISVLQTTSGVITGVSYEGGIATLLSGDMSFPMGNVISIRQPEE
ncbi:MAG: flagellar hook capping FlgD N-terminal domain-containing protein [Candidatus Neomarinimicrobiota bacterium]